MSDEHDARILLDEARRLDPDRTLCALLASRHRQPPILALIVLNAELARIGDVTHEPMAAMIRLQWWRDTLGSPTDAAHPLVAALVPALADGRIDRGEIEALIDARQTALEDSQPPDLAAMEAFAEATAGRLQRITAACLGGDAEALDAAADAGTAFGLVGLVRAVAFQARQSRQALPRDLLDKAAVDPRDIERQRMSAALAGIIAAILGRAQARLEAARRPRLQRSIRPALLPGRLARHYASEVARLGHDPFLAAALERPPWAVFDLLWCLASGRI